MAGSGFPTAGRIRELFAKYGKVAIAVHLSVSGISISGFYVAIKNNVDVEGVLTRIGLLGKDEIQEATRSDEERVGSRSGSSSSEEIHGVDDAALSQMKEDSKKKALISGGSALVLAILCNKALFPVRVPLTIALTPPVARFLARRKLYNAGN